MERLTKRLEDGQAVMDCAACGVSWHKKRKKDIPYCTALFCRNRLKERLAAYEDTGLEPDAVNAIKHSLMGKSIAEIKEFEGIPIQRLRELAQAEQDGRLVVLPCKVGDSVYIPDLEKKIPVKVRVQGISISVSGRTILHFGGYPVECAWGDGCGKDWFLSCGEAEAALAGKGGKEK